MYFLRDKQVNLIFLKGETFHVLSYVACLTFSFRENYFYLSQKKRCITAYHTYIHAEKHIYTLRRLWWRNMKLMPFALLRCQFLFYGEKITKEIKWSEWNERVFFLLRQSGNKICKVSHCKWRYYFGTGWIESLE